MTHQKTSFFIQRAPRALIGMALCAAMLLTACGKQAAPEAAAQLPQTGKTLSVLGDSISTFDGVCNDGTLLPALADNAAYFPQGDILAVEDVWWSTALKETGMTLLVDNAYSGGWVTQNMAGMGGTSGLGRCTLLGAGTRTPDVIACYIGVNDCRFSVPVGDAGAVALEGLDTETQSAEDFATGYAMLLTRMRAAYPEAQIWCCTLPAATADACGPETLGAYNDAIRTLAGRTGCRVVDLAADGGITFDNVAEYTLDGLHPNKAGMALLGQAFARALNAA